MTTSLLDGGGKSLWVKSKDLAASGKPFTGQITSVTERDFVPFNKTQPEKFPSGDIRRELLYNVDVNGTQWVLPVKESTDLHRKLKGASVKVDRTLGEIVGLTITVTHIGRGEPVGGDPDKAAHLHEVELS